MTQAPPRAAQVLDLDPATHVPHALHGTDAAWQEVNCSVDLWVELLHGLGLEPLAACTAPLTADLVGEQWSFLKFPAEDLRELYGVAVDEINVWRPLAEQAVEHLAAGRLLTVEVDAYWLPDTRGTDYRRTHTKTTIGLNALDLTDRRAGYFHGPGYHELTGEDLDGALGWRPGTPVLAPYVEVVDLTRLRRDDPRPRAQRLLAQHLARRAEGNPVQRLAERVQADLPWIAELGLEGYHGYAFGSVRQCGAGAALVAAALRWLGVGADAPFDRVAETAKALQFALARVARGRSADLTGPCAQLAADWATGVDGLLLRLS